MKNSRQFIINMVASLALFVINIGIGLVLSPFIVSRLGAEAYGYVSLANNLISYASILTVALDSVAGRFITVAYHRGDKELADRYFSSTLLADIVIAVAVSCFALPAIARLDTLINIEPGLVVDVKLLFVFIYLQFVATSLSTVLTVATFITNKLYLASLANVALAVTRVLIMIVFFTALPPHVYVVGLAACVGTVVMALINVGYTLRLTPELGFRMSAVSFPVVREMLSSGMWNVVTKLQQVVSFGLKLLLANLMVSPYKMGMLSISQTVPNMVSSLMGTVSGLFYPDQTRHFAEGKTNLLIDDLDSGIKVCGFFTIVTVAASITAGREFFVLWQPGQDADMLYRLMLIVMAGFLVSGAATSLQNVPLVVNRLKGYSLAWLAFSILSLPLTFALLELTSLEIYAVAAVPTAIEMAANILFVPIYVANVLGVSRGTFYPAYIRYAGASLLSIAASIAFKSLFNLDGSSWIGVAIIGVVSVTVSMVITFIVLLGSRERDKILGVLLSKSLRR